MIMLYGIENNELEKIISVIAKNDRVEKAVLYGSRAKGTFRTFSDVDITLIGNGLQRYDLNSIILAMDDLLLPYEFDISLFSTLKNGDLIDHINRVGVVIFQRVAEVTDLQKR